MSARAILACACVAACVLAASLWVIPLCVLSPGSDRAAHGDATQLVAGSDAERESVALSADSAIDARSRSLPEPPAIRGQLVDRDTGRPIPGWSVRLECPPELEESARLAATIRIDGALVVRGDPHVSAQRFRFENVLVERAGQDVLHFEAQAERRTQTSLLAFLGTTGRNVPAVAEPPPPAIEESATTEEPAPDHADLVAPEPAAPTDDAEPAPAEWTAASGTSLALGRFSQVTLSAHDPHVSASMVDLQLRTTASLQFHLAAAARPLELATWMSARGNLLALAAPRDQPVPRGNVLAETTTDADGRFELPCPGREDAWLVLSVQDALYPDPMRRDLGPSERACSRPLRWETRLVERATANVHVVDAATQEDVPFLQVVLSDDELIETCTTDAHGRFTSSRRFATGRVSAVFRDGPTNRLVSGALEAGSGSEVRSDDPRAILGLHGEIVFRVAIGPTFRLVWAEGTPPDVVLVRTRGLEPTPDASGIELERDWMLARTEEGHFVRLPAPVQPVEGGTPTLEISTDTLHYSEIELPHTVGRGETIRVHTRLGAHVRGRVLSAEGEPVPAVRVAVLDRRDRILDAVTSDESGAYSILALDPRAVGWIEVGESGGALRRSLPLTAGQDLELDLVLDPVPR